MQRDPKGWLLQGMCVCGKCGHVLKCLHQRPKESRYYACRGRVEHSHLTRDQRCDLPCARAEELELAVWRDVESVLRNRETLSQSVSDGLAELEDIRSHPKEGTPAIIPAQLRPAPPSPLLHRPARPGRRPAS